MEMKEVGLVLGGGGTKGSYEAGVWKALEEMEINITAICGTSIGAINAAIIVQGNIDDLVSLWKDTSMSQIINSSYNECNNLFQLKNLFLVAVDIYKNQTLDITPFKNLLEKLIDESKVRSSDIDFGLSTFSVTDRRELNLWKNDIPKGQLVDYILASAAIFGLPVTTLNDKAFFDGCIQNNLPVNMMIGKGYKNIIAVDVGGFGVVKNTDTSGVNMFTIKCSDNIIGMMEFTRSKIEKCIKMGYLDTFKVFGKLCGEKYYFEMESYNRSKMRYSQEILNGVECLASAFQLNRFYAYDIDGLIDKIIYRYEKYKKYYKNMAGDLSKDSILNILTQRKLKLNDALIVSWIVDLLKNGKKDFIKNKIVMNLLGDNYQAASTLMYLIEN